MKQHMVKNENIISIHGNLYWNCSDIDQNCNWKKYSQLKIWTLIISVVVYLICTIAIIFSNIHPLIQDALFVFISGLICLIDLILITRYRDKMEYQISNINYRISKIQKYIDDLKTCKIEYDIKNETAMYLEYFTQICNHLYHDPLINSSKLTLKYTKDNERCLKAWIEKMQKIIKESKRNNKNLRCFSQILQENEKTLILELQSLLQTTYNDKIYMLSHKVKINKNIKDDKLRIEYERFAKELLIVSDKKENFEIVCDQVSDILKKHGKSAYQFSKIYLNQCHSNYKSFEFIFSMISGAFFGNALSGPLELIDLSTIINCKFSTIVDIALPILLSGSIVLLFVLRDKNSSKKKKKTFYKIPNNDFIIIILQDFCNKYEKEILDDKLPKA